jgi:hypothetical protein
VTILKRRYFFSAGQGRRSPSRAVPGGTSAQPMLPRGFVRQTAQCPGGGSASYQRIQYGRPSFLAGPVKTPPSKGNSKVAPGPFKTTLTRSSRLMILPFCTNRLHIRGYVSHASPGHAGHILAGHPESRWDQKRNESPRSDCKIASPRSKSGPVIPTISDPNSQNSEQFCSNARH